MCLCCCLSTSLCSAVFSFYVPKLVKKSPSRIGIYIIHAYLGQNQTEILDRAELKSDEIQN